jgi:lipopolysaccharide/colanic/teichoic acid biosynthesis glycosyltransferase
MKTFALNHPVRQDIESVSVRIAHSVVPAWKIILDCTLVALAAPIWLPLGVLIAAWVKLVSPGPALFRQERIGHLGARFFCLKFRTMKINSGTVRHREYLKHLLTSNQPMKKLDNLGDSRLIPGSLLLRTLGLDELPQIINILRGEMSLVGPRPSTAYEYQMFEPQHRRRCGTLPGMTGLWQVRGKNRTTFQRMMELDLQYVEEKSLLLDLKILARTPIAILLQCWDLAMSRINAPAGDRQASQAAAGAAGLPAINIRDTARAVVAPAAAHRAALPAGRRRVDALAL